MIQKVFQANGFRMTLNQTGNVLSIPLSLLLMSIAMPYDQLSQITSGNQLVSSDQFLQTINYASLILGVIILIAVIPSLLRGSRQPKRNQ